METPGDAQGAPVGQWALANTNQLWAWCLLDELARCGVERAIVCPGSRSTPLALAAASHPSLQADPYVDERGAGFFAVGAAKRSGRPVAVVTTSGTAVANLIPAAIEAMQSGAPVIFVTADRPHELRGVGANQAIDQVKLLAAKWQTDLPIPECTPEALRFVRTTACRAVAHGAGFPAGPVHVNVPFRKPLDPTAGAALDTFAARNPEVVAGRAGGLPWTTIVPANPPATTIQVSGVGVILAGPGCAHDLEPLAAATGAAIFADPLSGQRRPGANVVAHYDAILANPVAAATVCPDWILQVGGSPTSKSLHQWLIKQPAKRILVDAAGHLGDEHHTAATILAGGGLPSIDGAAADAQWLTGLHALDAQTARALAESPRDWEGPIAATCLENLAGRDGLLFVGNSNPVRDLDRFARASDATVIGNRGASGIDGIIDAAAGAISCHDGPALAVIGDISFQHSLNGLAAWKRHAGHATLVVINNGGGAIFDRLPVATLDPAFTDYFVTPQELNIGAAAAAFGLPHQTTTGAALADLLAAGAPGVIEVVADRAIAVQRRRELAAALTQGR